MKVYLSGGMHTDWQDRVKALNPNTIWFDPRQHKLENPDAYTLWDLAAVRQCDVVFAFMEESNPSGVGLSLEVGYAIALGKIVILVDEKSDPRMAIVRSAASFTCDALEDGIQLLRQLEMCFV